MIAPRLTRLAAVVGLTIITLAVAHAAAPTPTPEQMQFFNQLPADQKAQLIRQYGGQQGNGNVANSPLPEPTIVQSRTVETDKNIEKAAQEATDVPTLEDDKQTKQVKQALKQFGYDLFAGTPTTFAPATDIPIPSEYIVGPGDTVQVQLFGKDNAEYDLVVSREGQLRFPGIGPIAVAGQRFDELKKSLRDRISRQMIGVKANITMGALRSIRVFVLGDADRPGSYTVSALSNMTNAMFVSGGIKPIGSLRDIQLKRQGTVVTHLDLYDLLLNGDTSNDARLQPGDVIFIPPIGKTVGVAGEVRRPAIYELKTETTAMAAVDFAGGLLPTSYAKATQLERINTNGNRTLLDLDLTDPAGQMSPLQDGDVLRVYSVLEKMDDIILLSGHVQRPGGLQWFKGMKVTDVFASVNDLLAKPELDYALIKREVLPDRHIEVVTLNLGNALVAKDSQDNIELQPRDEIIVFGQSSDTEIEKRKYLDDLVQQLRDQARFGIPEQVVSIKGNVRYPGDYPLSSGMRVSQLVRAAYDIKTKTDLDYALIVREQKRGEHIAPFAVALGKALIEPSGQADIVLQPKDNLYIFEAGDGRQEEILPVIVKLHKQARHGELAQVVTISGYVKAPGQYPLDASMRISDLIRAASGLTESAYTLSAELSRFKIVDGEYRQIEHFTIDQSDIFDGNVAVDKELQPYDHLHIKRLPQWTDQNAIELKGEVKFPGVYPFRRGETLAQVIKRAGGLTDYAFAQGAVFMREELRKKEQEQLDLMAARLESDLASISLEKSQQTAQSTGNDQSVKLAESLLGQLKNTKAVGRLVVDLNKIISANMDQTDTDSEYKVLLKDGDKLYIPAQTQEVTIIGEVHQSTSHLYQYGKDRDDYVSMSGGLTYKADGDRIYIVRANGAVVSENSSGWFGDSKEVRPGDTIVVPLDAERMKPLTFWTNITQIVYQLGIAAAAWQTVGVL